MSEFTVTELDMIADSAEVIARLNNWFERSKQHLSSRRDRWRKNEDLKAGNHWKHYTQRDSKTKIALNFPLANISAQMAIIADNMPTFDVIPREQNDVFFADMMQKRKKQLESQSRLFYHELDAIEDALTYSNGILEILPDFETLENGNSVLRGLDIAVIDIFSFFCDPWATGLNLTKGECLYYGFAVPMYVADIENMFEVKGIQAEGNLDEYRSFSMDTERDNSGDNESKMALLKEFFYRDPDLENYPNGRHTIMVGEMLLEDGKIELIRNPHFIVTNYSSPHSIFGMGEPEIDRTITKTSNEFVSAIAENFKKTGNPTRKITQRAKSKNPRPLRGEPGEEIIVDHPNDFSFEDPPRIPSYAQHFLEQIQMFRKEITGVNDALQGAKPPGVIAAQAIMALQESAQGRVRYKIEKEIKRFIMEIGEYITWLIQTYDQDIVTIRDKDKLGKWNFTTFDPINKYDANGIKQNEEGFDAETARALPDSEFDIDVSIGHRAPGGRMAKEARATDLFEKGIYGIEEWAAASNEPDKQSLVENFYRRQEMMAQGQEQGALPPELSQALQQLGEVVEPGNDAEQELMQLVLNTPEIIQSPEYQQIIPLEVRTRMMKLLLRQDVGATA